MSWLVGLPLVVVVFGGQYLAFRCIARRELRRRFVEALAAAELQAESWAEELERELSEAA